MSSKTLRIDIKEDNPFTDLKDPRRVKIQQMLYQVVQAVHLDIIGLSLLMRATYFQEMLHPRIVAVREVLYEVKVESIFH